MGRGKPRPLDECASDVRIFLQPLGDLSFESGSGFCCPAETAPMRAGYCLQDSMAGPNRRATGSITQTCEGTELLFARSPTPAFKNQTPAAQCFKSKAELLFARSSRCRPVAHLLSFAVAGYAVDYALSTQSEIFAI